MMLKRSFDVIIALLGLALLAPALILIGTLVKLSSPGTVLYRSRRVGQNGKIFTLYKFRSMIVNADQLGPGITGKSDQRITSVGRVLRRSKLDELPQLFNVLRGDMSIVGPRPEDPRYVGYYTDAQRQVLSVRPGITSPASIRYRDEESILDGGDWEMRYIQEVLPSKLDLDLQYAQEPNLWKDLVIILRTLRALFR